LAAPTAIESTKLQDPVAVDEQIDDLVIGGISKRVVHVFVLWVLEHWHWRFTVAFVKAGRN
jgi:hypothetical protein